MKNEKTKETDKVENEVTEEKTSEVSELELLQKKCDETNDKYLRTLAEYDNFRKRTAKERDGIYQEAYVDAVKNLLPIIDNMERAVDYASDDASRDGIKMIISSAYATLEKMGVKLIETKTFDPLLHNAVMHIDDESLGEGEIVEVFQKGYILGERVIRYAMVKVAN